MKSFFLQIKVVTKETPGYLPILSATSHSVAAPPSSEGAGDIKLYYQTSPESDLFCVICHKNYKNYGTLMNHLKKVHGKTLVLKCDKCETEFTDGKAFGLHNGRKTDCTKFKKKSVIPNTLTNGSNYFFLFLGEMG